MATPAQKKQELRKLRNTFATTLSLADDASFLLLTWSLNALRNGQTEQASSFLKSYPPDAATDGLLGKNAIFPWELETLVNELLATPKHPYYRIFDCRAWDAATDIINQLRELENSEYGANKHELNIFVEMGRIGARQFPWQRGFITYFQLYRNAFIYGKGACAAYLKEKHGLSVHDMTLVGYTLFSVFDTEAVLQPAKDMSPIYALGIDREKLSRTLRRIVCSLDEVRSETLDLRKSDDFVAYKPSILRKYPCILVGQRSRKMVVPLPELIMDRVTNGLYYDVIGGDGAVREEIGKRFEAYSLALLREMITDTRFEPESRYSTCLGPVDTPDILMLNSEAAVRLAIECKAPRMRMSARFGASPQNDRGYDEIAKGVMQLWRFFAHCRLETAPNRLTANVQGMVLTMDEWFAGRSTVIPEIYKRANELADSSPHSIPHEHRKAVAFCTISELEEVLKTATTESLLEAVHIGTGERAGWMFSSLHDEAVAEKAAPRAFPFKDALRELLPWYAKIQELAEDVS